VDLLPGDTQGCSGVSQSSREGRSAPLADAETAGPLCLVPSSSSLGWQLCLGTALMALVWESGAGWCLGGDSLLWGKKERAEDPPVLLPCPGVGALVGTWHPAP